jgi:hypothetical protein
MRTASSRPPAINHPLEAPACLHDTSARIAAMDTQGIDVEALSINLLVRADRDSAAQLIKIQNDPGGILRRQPRPLVAFATAALQHPEPPLRSNTRLRPSVSRRRRRRQRRREELANPAHPSTRRGTGVLVFMHPLARAN